MFAGIHHAAIICSDYQKSRQFYTEILGLKIIAENYRSQRDSWKLDLALADGSQIELFSFPNPPARTSRPEAAGLRHLAFRVCDLDAVYRTLQVRGVSSLEGIRVDEYTGKRYTFFSDPDGLPLELYEIKYKDDSMLDRNATTEEAKQRSIQREEEKQQCGRAQKQGQEQGRGHGLGQEQRTEQVQQQQQQSEVGRIDAGLPYSSKEMSVFPLQGDITANVLSFLSWTDVGAVKQVSKVLHEQCAELSNKMYG
jgi:glyoxylase I family protein